MRAIVFIVRGCSAGWLGAYGNEWVATPNLDRLAAEAVVFDRHLSDCPRAAAAQDAWLNRGHVLDELRGAGSHTVLVHANHPDTNLPSSFYAGWSEVFDARPQPDDPSPLDNLIRSLPSLLDRLAALPRWLLWIEIDRLLPPWSVPQDVFDAYIRDEDNSETDEEEPVEPCFDPPAGPFDRSDLAAWQWVHSSFAAVVTTLDAELGAAFEELRARGFDQTATWILTADHGYPLGEHGQIGLISPRLHEELVHVPLLLRLPAAAEADRRVADLTQPPDLAPTLLDLFGLAPAQGSLLPLAHGARTIREAAIATFECGGATETAIRTKEWTLLLPGPADPSDAARAPLLFTAPDDRWEVNDVLSQHQEVAEQLRTMAEGESRGPSDSSGNS
jgi:arylsulfatase A-like enzyme